MTHPPRMNHYARHVLLCTGRYCAPDGQVEALYARLPLFIRHQTDFDVIEWFDRFSCVRIEPQVLAMLVSGCRR